MFKLIKTTIQICILVLAFIGFNAIGGQKYIELAKGYVKNFINTKITENAKNFGNFSDLHEEFEIDNTFSILGHNAMLAEHVNSGQKMCIIYTKNKALLTKEDIISSNLEQKLQNLTNKFKYQAISFHEVKVLSKGTMSAYGQNIPYAKIEAKANKLPFSDLTGIVASIRTSDGKEKLLIAINEKKKYSQLIAEEFYKNIKEK